VISLGAKTAVTVPTVAQSDNSTNAATTAFVKAKTFTECSTLFDINGLAATSDIPSFYRAPAAITVTEVWCETDVASASTITLEKDGGNDLTTACSCTSTPGTCTLTGTGADKQYADGVLMDFVFVTAGSSVKRLNFCVEYTYD
jgi:hypothetical protein